MAGRARRLAPQTVAAAQVLGQQIGQARRLHGWTAAELADRVGVSVRTISNLEHGSPSVALGTAFEAATIVGVRLFGADGPELVRLVRQGRETLALLPDRVYRREDPIRDDF